MRNGRMGGWVEGTHMRGCADSKDRVYTRRRVGVELDVENLDWLDESASACRYLSRRTPSLVVALREGSS